LVTVRA
jgi:hypothetical protein